MSEMKQSSTLYKNGFNEAVEATTVSGELDQEGGPTIIEAEPVTVTVTDVAPDTAEMFDEAITPAVSAPADGLMDEETAVSITADPEFDKIQAITRFLVGGVLEGADEFTKRLELWEAYLREELPVVPLDLSETSERDLLRYGLVGFIFESEDTGRALLKKLLKVPGGVARTAVRPTKSVANSRFTRPIRHRLDRMADRGGNQIMRWIERGYAEEPLSRNLARLGVAEITDEYIDLLAQNEELKELVQEQSIGLAGEAVGQVRERSFSADTLIERIARAVTRRSPRLEPPLADLSEFHGGKRFFEGDDTG